MCGILNEVGENDERVIFVAGESGCVAITECDLSSVR